MCHGTANVTAVHVGLLEGAEGAGICQGPERSSCNPAFRETVITYVWITAYQRHRYVRLSIDHQAIQ